MNENPDPAGARRALRAQLKTARQDWLAGSEAAAGQARLAEALGALLRQLEPLCLGLYWPLPGEFDAASRLPPLPGVLRALPWAEPGGAMHYRRWLGDPPSLRDGMGIPSVAGPACEPDLVLVPCLGFTRAAYRLGYGGGYFDRWLAERPGVTAVGLAWAVGECSFTPQPHDQRLAMVLTERELMAP